jgi:hypothetical protein
MVIYNVAARLMHTFEFQRFSAVYGQPYYFRPWPSQRREPQVTKVFCAAFFQKSGRFLPNKKPAFRRVFKR